MIETELKNSHKLQIFDDEDQKSISSVAESVESGEICPLLLEKPQAQTQNFVTC